MSLCRLLQTCGRCSPVSRVPASYYAQEVKKKHTKLIEGSSKVDGSLREDEARQLFDKYRLKDFYVQFSTPMLSEDLQRYCDCVHNRGDNPNSFRRVWHEKDSGDDAEEEGTRQEKAESQEDDELDQFTAPVITKYRQFSKSELPDLKHRYGDSYKHLRVSFVV